MGYSITVWAEKKAKGSDQWHMVTKNWIILDAKYILLGAEDDCCEFDAWNSYQNDIKVEELSPELRRILKPKGNEDMRYYKEVSMMEIYERTSTIQKKAEIQMKSLCKALGMSVHEEEWDGEWYVDQSSGYDENGRKTKKFNPLTFPVNKELVEDIVRIKKLYDLSHYWNGICLAVKGNAGCGWCDEDHPDIRFIMEYDP